MVPIDLESKPIKGIPLLGQISKIIYELSLGAAAVRTFDQDD